MSATTAEMRKEDMKYWVNRAKDYYFQGLRGHPSDWFFETCDRILDLIDKYGDEEESCKK